MTKELNTTGTLPAQATESLPPEYGDLLREIKAEIAAAHVRVHRVVNTELITHCWRIGRIILERQAQERWGTQDLETALVEHIVRFPQELGVGFAFVGRQYPLRVGSQEFRIDLLFYHLRLHRYVVIELKVGRAEPEHFGKLGFYTAVVDDKVRDPDRDDRTLGILIAAHRDEEVVQYALRGTAQPLAVTTYQTLPAEMRPLLPSPEQLSRVAHEVLVRHTGER